MNNNPNQPRVYDAVLGGQSPPPLDGVILGGLEGVKSRFKSPVVEARVAALSEALKYGEAGLDLIIQALKDPSGQVQHSASLVLKREKTLKVRQALLEYDPWLFFTTLANWKLEKFDPQIGITDPVGTAYVVELDQFKILLQNPQANQVEALVCQMWDDYESYTQFSTFVDALFAAQEQLTSLKALYIGDGEEPEYMKSFLELSDISPILEAYPNLEVLQVRGSVHNLQISTPRHDHLKTFIVETLELNYEAIAQICALDLPALEYLELWIGLSYIPDHTKIPDHIEIDGIFYILEPTEIDSLIPIVFDDLFPNLSYLGLRSSEYADRIASMVVQSPIIDRLKVLDMSMGTLTDEGAEALLNCPAINQLHTLNVAKNYLSTNMIQQLSQLNCRVIAEPQDHEYGDRYQALHE